MKRTAIIHIVLALVFVLICFGADVLSGNHSTHEQLPGGVLSLVLTVVWLASLTIDLGVMFRARLERNRLCSYYTVAELGLLIFTASSAVIFTGMLLFSLANHGQIQLDRYLYYISWLAFIFAYLDIPIIATVALFLAVSNVFLLRHEGIHPTNMLGFFVNIAALVGYALIIYAPVADSSSLFSLMNVGAQTALAYLMSYFESMYLALVVCSVMAARNVPEPNKDYVIVLGCGIRKDGTPTPLLKGRVDRALDFVRSQLRLTGKQAALVCSGGKGSDEVMSEAQCMANYLAAVGVAGGEAGGGAAGAEARDGAAGAEASIPVLIEDQSVNTLQNMQFSQRLIAGRDAAAGAAAGAAGAAAAGAGAAGPAGAGAAGARIAYATTNYHVFRAGIFAHEAGLDAEGMGATTKWYFWPNAFLRETVAFFAANRSVTLVTVAGIVAFGIIVGALSVFAA